MAADLRDVLASAATALEQSANDLNVLDGFAGDGDMGITMGEVARAVKDVVADSAGKTTAELLSACGAAIARRAPSTSGTLMATGLLRAAKTVGPGAAGTAGGGEETQGIARAFAAALEGIQARGKAAVGDRTLVDGLDAVCTSLRESAETGLTWPQALLVAAGAAHQAADATAAMEPKTGRASWAPQRALGHPDAGCVMLARVLDAVATRASRSSA